MCLIEVVLSILLILAMVALIVLLIYQSATLPHTQEEDLSENLDDCRCNSIIDGSLCYKLNPCKQAPPASVVIKVIRESTRN